MGGLAGRRSEGGSGTSANGEYRTRFEVGQKAKSIFQPTIRYDRQKPPSAVRFAANKPDGRESVPRAG
jgi:hypothetical protein